MRRYLALPMLAILFVAMAFSLSACAIYEGQPYPRHGYDAYDSHGPRYFGDGGWHHGWR